MQLRTTGRTLLIGLVLGVAVFGSRPYAQGPAGPRTQGAQTAPHVRNELLIQFRAAASEADKNAAHGFVNAQRRRLLRSGDGDLELAVLPPGMPVDVAVDVLSRHPAVSFAEPNWTYTHQEESNDLLYQLGFLWGLYGDETTPANQFGSQAAEAWAAGEVGSRDVVVAVIDQGIDLNHSELADNIWANPGEIPGNGVDDDGNGYVDDVHGWDFYNHDASIYDGPDLDAHGTHLAGTIGAEGGDGGVLVGVNWRVSLVSAKFLGPDGGSTADVVQALDYLIDLKSRHGLNLVAANNSYGGAGYSQALHDAIIRAAKAGILFVAAAGNGDANGIGQDNDAAPLYPANYDTSIGTSTESAADYDSVITVAAITSTGSKASFSNYGATTVDLGAPGEGIYSTTPGDTFGGFSGTSMAAPHVTGAAALYRSMHPNASASEIKDAILASAVNTPTSSLGGATATVTGGRLNIGWLVDNPPPQDPNLPPVTVTASAPQAAEAGPTSGMFTVARTGDTSAPLTVHYSVGGTAVADTDYVALPGTVTIDAGASVATIAVVPIDDLTFESDESVVLTIRADAAYNPGSPREGIVTIVSDDHPPDLVVSSMTAPASGGADMDIVVTDTTTNQGTGSAATSKTGFYLSTNISLDAADILLGSRSVPPLDPGTADVLTTTVHLPASTTTGWYYVLAAADWTGVVQESIETNNVRRSSLMKIGPDVTVSALIAPAGAAAGGTFNVSDTTKNQGGGSAGASTTRFYLSANMLLDASDVILGSRPVPLLAPGASDGVSTSLTVPAATAAGSYFVIALADAESAVLETAETNNDRSSLAVKIGPDLVVTAVSAPSTAAAGATITVTDTTKNQGSGPAPAASTGFYLSANITIDSTDVFLGSRVLGPLAPGGIATASTPLQIPAGTPSGNYYIVARADRDNVVGESAENNNDKSSGAVLTGGDLVLSSVSAPASATANSAITVTDTTKNQGTSPLPGSATGFYLSPNTTLNSTDVFLGSRAVGALAPSATDTASTPLVIPAGTAPGSYYVIGVADWNGTVTESIETNNTRRSSAVNIGPDVIVSAVTAQLYAVAGTTISVGDTTKNQGGDAVPASVTKFYLSVNSSLDASDVLLASRPVPSLAAGTSNAGSLSVTIPLSTAARIYYIIAKADGDNTIAEALESNNTRAKAISISAP